MSFSSIDSLLLRQINNGTEENPFFTDSKNTEIPIVLESINDERSGNGERLEVYNLYGNADSLSKCHTQQNGVYQISIMTEQNCGSPRTQDLAQELFNRFSRVTEDTVQTDQPNLNIETISLNTPIVEGEFYRVDMSVNYFHYNDFR